MKIKTRTHNSIRNSLIGVICKIIALIFSFVVRTFFIHKLGQEILGIEGLFTSIIAILNLADLGISTAIIFILYKPIADNDNAKVSAIVSYFHKFYNIVGIIVLILGLLITPLVPYLVNLTHAVDNLYLYYILTIILTSCSYFFASTRCLFEASQNTYIVTIIDTIISMISSTCRLFVLLLTKNYALYIAIAIIFTILGNLIIYIWGHKKFQNVYSVKSEPLSSEDSKLIKTNMRAVMAHKIGSVLVTGTDNLLISLFVSTIVVGIYSNYLLIINTVTMIVTLAITALTPSVGNLKVTSQDSKKDYSVFKLIYFISFWLICVTTICMFVLFNQFIINWVGESYLFDIKIVLLLCVNYFISTMRHGIGVFATAAGYFKETWFKPFLEGIINLVVSIILSKFIGVSGIFLGTTISLLLGSFWIDPVVTYKKWFKKSAVSYFLTYAIRLIICLFCGILCYYVVGIINLGSGWINWLIKAFVCFGIVNVVLLIFFGWTSEFRLLMSKLKIKKNKD